jgi:GT2 family glycosyltransferase
LIRVDAFKEVNGFRSSLIAGEEPELCARLRERGWKVWRLEAEMTRHDAAMTRFHQWWRRAVRSGYAEAESARLHVSSGDMAREKRAVASAVVWAGLLPIFVLIASLLNSVFLALALIYVVQLVRIAVRKGATAPESWAYAAFMMLAKFAELQGIARYVWNFLLGKTARTIEYKQIG